MRKNSFADENIRDIIDLSKKSNGPSEWQARRAATKEVEAKQGAAFRETMQKSAHN
jgi:hypothetical protein